MIAVAERNRAVSAVIKSAHRKLHRRGVGAADVGVGKGERCIKRARLRSVGLGSRRNQEIVVNGRRRGARHRRRGRPDYHGVEMNRGIGIRLLRRLGQQLWWGKGIVGRLWSGLIKLDVIWVRQKDRKQNLGNR